MKQISKASLERVNQRQQLAYEWFMGQLSGDGTLRGRMNAAPGAPDPYASIDKPQLQEIADRLQKRWLAGEVSEAEILEAICKDSN